jgi:lipopolysaccharide transport system ATP-binding protein
VKHYSSGMYVRLAFAVAAHLEPEILLVDEVLAVGDAAFQKKCLGKMGEVSREGRTVLFVSHNMAAVKNMCPTAYLLDQGLLVLSGPAEQVINQYLQSTVAVSDASLPELIYREGDGRMRFTDVIIRDVAGNPINVISSGQDIVISIGYAAHEDEPLRNVSITIGFHSLLGQFLFLCENEMVGKHFGMIPPRGRINCHIPHVPLSSGTYGFNFHCSVNGIMADFVKQHVQFLVTEGDFFGTGKLPPTTHRGFLVNHSWSIEGKASL